MADDDRSNGWLATGARPDLVSGAVASITSVNDGTADQLCAVASIAQQGPVAATSCLEKTVVTAPDCVSRETTGLDPFAHWPESTASFHGDSNVYGNLI